MASCPKCGKHIKSRYGVKKCKRHGFLESSRKPEDIKEKKNAEQRDN